MTTVAEMIITQNDHFLQVTLEHIIQPIPGNLTPVNSFQLFAEPITDRCGQKHQCHVFLSRQVPDLLQVFYR